MNHKLLSKAFVGLSFFLMLFFVFNLGIDAAKADGKEAVIDGVQAIFWLFAFWLFTRMNRVDEKLDRELEKSHKELDDLLGEIARDHEKSMDQKRQFVDIFGEVVGKSFFDVKSVNAKQVKEIQKRYTDKTGRYAEIKNLPKNEGINVNLSDKPFTTAPTTKKAPVKKSVVKKTVEQLPKPPVVKKSNAKKKGNK